MQSSVVKYGIIALGILFLASNAEISSDECQQYYNTESHVFIGADNSSIGAGASGIISPVVKFPPFATVPLDVVSPTALSCIDNDRPAAYPPAHLGVPLYLNISSLRI
ncbi:hypothetical protein D4R75_05310 [bacterium]|nr:MAG: hypothetical protein D4R75_05310 [bacterium]